MLTLLVSAIRSIVHQRAVVERIVGVENTGAQVITIYYVEIAHGTEAVQLDWQRTILPVVRLPCGWRPSP